MIGPCHAIHVSWSGLSTYSIVGVYGLTAQRGFLPLGVVEASLWWFAAEEPLTDCERLTSMHEASPRQIDKLDQISPARGVTTRSVRDLLSSKVETSPVEGVEWFE
jgi:hypothetical protein